MNDNKEVAVIDLRLIFQKIREHKLLYIIVLPIAFVLSVFIILCVPRYYSTDTKLAPEVENGGSSGAIGSLASSLGFDMSQIKSSDAIYLAKFGINLLLICSLSRYKPLMGKDIPILII